MVKMTMRILIFLYFGLAVGLMAPSGAAVAETPVPPLSAPQADPAPRYMPLRDVLPELSEQTGIQFQVPDSLHDELIPWQEEGGKDGSPSMDWVRNFSHIDLVDEETGQRKIILLTSNSGTAPVHRKASQIRRAVPGKPKPTLSREKALKIGGIPEHSLIRAWEEN
jgi:hypothetical protein